jgi:NAD(P)-dependent dehydrogenase (short-subunit alcohol dehydrogenase family)
MGMHVYLNGVNSIAACSLAELISKKGADLFLTDDNADALQLAIPHLDPASHTGSATINSREQYQIEYAVNKAYAFLGPIDCAINNYFLPEMTTNIIDCSPEFYNYEFKGSFLRAFLFIKYEMSLLLGLQKGGKIINLFHLTGNDLLQDSHATYAFMCAMKGLSTSISETYKEQKIKVESFLLRNSKHASGYNGVWLPQPAIDLNAPEGTMPVPDICRSIIDSIYKMRNQE